jgi:hypothetical protein
MADARKARGESTGPPPTPTVPIKRRYDGPGGALQRSAIPTMETAEDLPTSHQPIGMQNASSPKPSTASRFPALAQAGPVAQTTQPSRTISASKPIQTQPQTQQWVQQVLQHQQHQRGPPLGYFTADRERPTLQPASTQPSIGISDPLRRSEVVAKEAQWERDNAMRLQEQQARDQQVREQQAREQQAREQHAREQQARQQHQQQQQRQRLGEQQVRRQQQALKSETDSQNLSQYEQYSTQGQQPNIIARSRIEDPSSMYIGEMRRGPSTLLYTPRDPQNPRDMGSDNVGGGPSGLMSNPAPQLSRATTTAPHVHPDPPVAPRPQPPAMTAARQQDTVRKTSSIMSLLNTDEPTDQRIPPIKRNSDGPPVPVQPSPSPVAQQPLYTPARSLSGGQPGQMRRKASIGEIQGPGHSYPRSTGTAQGQIRVVESPYSAAVQSQAQARSQIGSTMDAQPASDRDSYPHQQYGMQRPQQPPANSQQYQPGQPTHRQSAFAPSNKRTASPPGQYAPLQASRNSSFDYPPAQVHYGPGPTGPPTTMGFQSAPQAPHHPLSTVRYSQTSYQPSPYDTRENYRTATPAHTTVDRMQAEQQQQQILQQRQRDEETFKRRLEERRYEDSRRQ